MKQFSWFTELSKSKTHLFCLNLLIATATHCSNSPWWEVGWCFTDNTNSLSLTSLRITPSPDPGRLAASRGGSMPCQWGSTCICRCSPSLHIHWAPSSCPMDLGSQGGPETQNTQDIVKRMSGSGTEIFLPKVPACKTPSWSISCPGECTWQLN